MTLVLITTSGTGSRLGKVTEFTNKSLVPVGDRLALARIIDAYPQNTRFIITTGYHGDKVKEFIKLAYPTRDIKFIDIDLYEGPGSSLLYSMLQAKSHLQEPFYFHCCDTILTKDVFLANENTVYVTKNPKNYNLYASIKGSNGIVNSFHKKGYKDNDYVYIGLAYYKDYNKFWEEAENHIKHNPTDQSLSDINCIISMLANSNFNYIIEETVYDTGNMSSYQECLSSFKSNKDILIKNNESLHFDKDFVLKFVADKSLNKKRIQRGYELYPYAPKIIDFTDHFIKMEYIQGQLLSDSKNYFEVDKLLEWATHHLWKNPQVKPEYKNTCYQFYIKKTNERLSQLKIKDTCTKINGIDVGTIDTLLQIIPENLILTDTLYCYHGDFILDNIIKRQENSYCLLDWRHEFGDQISKGDMYYDLAKLKHNIIFNHNNIVNNLYSVNYLNDSVEIDLKCNYSLICQLEAFHKFLTKHGYDENKVNILTAIIWLNMAPLYSSPLQDFLFYFGKFHLFKSLSTIGIL